MDRRVGDQIAPVKRFPVQVNGADLMVIVGRVVIDPLIRIAAGGVERDLVLALAQLAAAALLVHAAENVEKLAHTLIL